MLQDTEKEIKGISNFGEDILGRINEAKKRERTCFTSPSATQIISKKSPSTFKVYDKVLAKHRYVPRVWTQEEFEAALPERFKGRTENNPDKVIKKASAFDNAKFEIHNKKVEKKTFLTSSEKTNETSCSNPEQQHDTNGENVKNLKEIFEKVAADSNGEYKTKGGMQMRSIQQENKCGKIETRNETEELERCKDSEAKVKLAAEETETVIKIDENPDILHEVLENEPSESFHPFSSFLNACLRCFYNIEQFVTIFSNMAATADHNSSPAVLKLGHLSQSIEDTGHLSQPTVDDLFSDFHHKFSRCQTCDEVLAVLLDILIQQTDAATTKNENVFRSLIQGKLCHVKSCNCCCRTTKESQSFLFLNPVTPPADPVNRIVLDINFISCGKDGVWYVATQQFFITPGMTIADLKEELLSCSEFYTSGCGASSIRIGEVNRSRLVAIFEDDDDLLNIQLRPNSSIFAFHLLNFHSEFPEELKSLDNLNTLTSSPMSYHLSFNCGLCLSDGTDVRLFIHKNCGGMVCSDCLDVITQSYHDWELCPCPICERPINLDSELSTVRSSDAKRKEQHTTKSNLQCQVLFRAEREKVAELFGCPLLVSLPREVTGYHLYRCIGYLLPSALLTKDRTSFTLRTVDKTGLHCSTCRQNTCNGCLIRIDDNIRITSDTNLVVHFDEIAEESKKNFGSSNSHETPVGKSQSLFDGILQSFVRASTSKNRVCTKCFNPCKVSSSIVEFPQLLLIQLNELYAETGLPQNTIFADVSSFLVVQHGEGVKANLTYQLKAVVVADESGATPTYKASIREISNDNWVLYDESHLRKVNLHQMQLTKNSLLFYQPVFQTPSSDFLKNEHVLQMPSLGKTNETCHAVREVPDKHTTIEKETDITPHLKKGTNLKRDTTKSKSPKKRLRVNDKECDPGEYLEGTRLGHQGLARNSNVSSSHLSLGEITYDDSAAGISNELDGISPISIQEMWQSDPRVVRETRKLIRAVKREDAYRIVCSLKKGANPCLLVNDVSALHLAVGVKSEQRCSMVAYLLKYSSDVNVGTADGTTPMHVAASWGHQDAMELLLAHGGDAFDTTDQEGNSAFDIATKNCSSFLQLYQSDFNSLGQTKEPSTSSNTSVGTAKELRLEDIVRSNVTLPSHVEDTRPSRIRRRWLKRIRTLKDKSSSVLKSLRRMSSIRRRSRIGVMVSATREENSQNQ